MWTPLCPLADLTPNQGTRIEVGLYTLALFLLDDSTVRVIDDTCPHAGASLSGGFVEGGCVICPRHAWHFNLTTGQMPDDPQTAIPTFPTKIENGQVYADLPE